MPVPVNKPLNLERMNGNVASVANGVVSIGSPWAGHLTKVGVNISAPVTTACTLAIDINGVAIPGATITIPTGGTEGTAYVLNISATCNEDDGIGFTFSGGGAGGGNVTVFYEVRQGPN